MYTILNIAAGKLSPVDLPKPYFLINTDTMYYQSSPPHEIENDWLESKVVRDVNRSNTTYYSAIDIFKFMERTKILFDNVCIYRFLEHITMDKLQYFIYLVSTITFKGSKIDIIVPNYKTLATMILQERITDNNFEANNILLTTELLNQPPDPHATIWTLERMKYFWELEGRFKIISMDPEYEFDGRNIYIRTLIERG